MKSLRHFFASFKVAAASSFIVIFIYLSFMKDTVYIYADPKKDHSITAMMLENFGQSFAKNGLKVKPIFATEILQERWIDQAAAIIFGGAESTKFRKALSQEGIFRKDIIQRAHNEGVHYIGTCGGAFIGWDHIHFTGSDDYVRVGEGFGLYPRKSFGAPSGFTPKDFNGRSDSAAILSMKHKPTGRYFHSLYCCGPHFPQEDMPDNAHALASAVHPISGKEHIMAVQIPAIDGRGSVSLYGHHPEYLAPFIDSRTREFNSLPIEDERLRRNAYQNGYGILLGFNFMLLDLKTAMGLSYEPQRLIVPAFSPT